MGLSKSLLGILLSRFPRLENQASVGMLSGAYLTKQRSASKLKQTKQRKLCVLILKHSNHVLALIPLSLGNLKGNGGGRWQRWSALIVLKLLKRWSMWPDC